MTYNYYSTKNRIIFMSHLTFSSFILDVHLN